MRPTPGTTMRPRPWARPAGATFTRVTLPLALPGIVSGAVLSWARALGEFGATVTFAGNFPGTTRTMPTEVYLSLPVEPGRRHRARAWS